MSTSFTLTIPLHPRTPLFPYTTLFRSKRRDAVSEGSTPERSRRCAHHRDLDLNRGQKPLRIAFQGSRDRKSTRLNSSHLVISYSVFCLKKKMLEGILLLFCIIYCCHLC